MKKPILMLAFTLAAFSAKAETLPADMLDKEYTNCIGSPAGGADEQKRKYCLCIRNKLATWDMAAYAHIAQEMAATGSTTAPPELEAIAKECIVTILK